MTVTPDDCMIDVYCAISYARRATAAALIANHMANRMNDPIADALGRKALEDGYCAAGFAWRAKNTKGVFAIEYLREDARRAKDTALKHTAQVYERALDGDPAVIEHYEPMYQALLKTEALFEALTLDMNLYAESLSCEGVTPDDVRERYIEECGAEPPALPDAQVIEEAWQIYLKDYPSTLLLPNTFTALAERLIAIAGEKAFTLETLASAIASSQAAERGPQGECRYCGTSFKKARESISKGVCGQCEHTQATEALAIEGVNVLAYDPYTGELVTDQDIDEDDTGPSLN